MSVGALICCDNGVSNKARKNNNCARAAYANVNLAAPYASWLLVPAGKTEPSIVWNGITILRIEMAIRVVEQQAHGRLPQLERRAKSNAVGFSLLMSFLRRGTTTARSGRVPMKSTKCGLNSRRISTG